MKVGPLDKGPNPDRTRSRIANFVGVVFLAGILIWYASPNLSERWAQSRVRLQVAYDLVNCESATPLRLTVHNKGQRKIRNVGWRLVVRQEGDDVDLVKSGTFSIMPFLKPHYLGAQEGRSSCLAVPSLDGRHDPSTLVYEIAHKRVWFLE